MVVMWRCHGLPMSCEGVQVLLSLVTDAFQQAKRRMMDARENLHTEYVETLKMFDAGDTEA